MSANWDWGIFFQPAPFGNTTYLGWILSGLKVTVLLSICAGLSPFWWDPVRYSPYGTE